MYKLGNRLIAIAMAAGLVTWMNVAHAAIFTETYSYADGELATVSGGNWINHSGTVDSQIVTSGVLSMNDNGTRDYNRSFTSVTTGSLYAGFDLTVSDVDGPTSSSATDAYFIHFGQSSATNLVSRVLLNDGTSANTFKIGITRGTGTGVNTTFWGTELTQGQQYRIVMGYDIDNNIATLWVNPTSIGDTNIANSSGTTDPSGLSIIATRVDGTPDGDKLLDNLIVSTTFGEVVPEPSSLALGGLLLFTLPRRRRAV